MLNFVLGCSSTLNKTKCPCSLDLQYQENSPVCSSVQSYYYFNPRLTMHFSVTRCVLPSPANFNPPICLICTKGSFGTPLYIHSKISTNI